MQRSVLKCRSRFSCEPEDNLIAAKAAPTKKRPTSSAYLSLLFFQGSNSLH